MSFFQAMARSMDGGLHFSVIGNGGGCVAVISTA